MNIDKEFLQEAINISIQSVDNGGGPFGAVVVKDGKIIGRGNNQVTLNNDPTAHAEVTAIRDACKTINDFSLKGCTIYASCEPCPMCIASIYWARIERVVFAATGEDAAHAGFDDNVIAKELCIPYEKRSMLIEHLECDGCTEVFSRWVGKLDKTLY